MSTLHPGPALGRFLLGLFVVVQLLFLFICNLDLFILDGLSDKQKRSVLARPLVEADNVMDEWIRLTGQGQHWRLFAPLVPTLALFVIVENEDEPPEQRLVLSSNFEPDAAGRYFHFSLSGDRLFHAEKELAWPLIGWDPEEIAKKPQEWQDALVKEVRDQWRSYRSYLAWRTRAPDGSLPRSMILSVRIYPTSVAGRMPLPEEVVTLPLVRWRPDQEPPDDCLPLEVYNAQERAFHFLPDE